jgi:hypothetical protein
MKNDNYLSTSILKLEYIRLIEISLAKLLELPEIWVIIKLLENVIRYWIK